MKWAKLSRRGTALLASMAAVWCLLGASGAGAADQRQSENGPLPGEAPGFWARLLAGQSPYLKHGKALTFTDPDGQGVTDDSQDAEPPDSAPASVEREDEPTLSPPPDQAQNVVARTLLPTSDGSYPSSGGVFLYNRTGQAVDMEALTSQPPVLTGQGKGPQILIVHTHATEAYTQSDQDLYTQSDPYRTLDDAHNVVRVGDEMAAAFAQAGLNVLHDRTLHDYPAYDGSYSRSQVTVEEYLAAYPSISVVLDVHRDALVGDDGTVYKAMAEESTAPDCAQVMLVVGTDENNGKHPQWRSNLTFAIALERALNENAPTLARPISLRKSHYNQFLSPGSLLVEVGSHGNSLPEAMNAARLFAQTAAPVIADLLTAQEEAPS